MLRGEKWKKDLWPNEDDVKKQCCSIICSLYIADRADLHLNTDMCKYTLDMRGFCEFKLRKTCVLMPLIRLR